MSRLIQRLVLKFVLCTVLIHSIIYIYTALTRTVISRPQPLQTVNLLQQAERQNVIHVTAVLRHPNTPGKVLDTQDTSDIVVKYSTSEALPGLPASSNIVPYSKSTLLPSLPTSGRRVYNTYGSYRYIHVPIDLCSDKEPGPFLTILVKSSIFQIGNREAIRATWGNHRNSSIRVVFLLGYSMIVEQHVAMESSLYNDVIQQDFIDVYNNNTLKTMMGFDWLVSYCSNSKYVFFVDDDYFVNLPKMLLYLDYHYKRRTKNFIAGFKYNQSRPNRHHGSKWYFSEQDYNGTFWPPYLSGGSMIMEMKIAKRIYFEIPYIKPLFIDDVFLGFVVQSLGIKLLNEPRFHPKFLQRYLHLLYSSHKFGSPQNLVREWTRVTRQHKDVFGNLYNVSST